MRLDYLVRCTQTPGEFLDTTGQLLKVKLKQIHKLEVSENLADDQARVNNAVDGSRGVLYWAYASLADNTKEALIYRAS